MLSFNVCFILIRLFSVPVVESNFLFILCLKPFIFFVPLFSTISLTIGFIVFLDFQLQSDYTIFHYGIRLGNVIQVLTQDLRESKRTREDVATQDCLEQRNDDDDPVKNDTASRSDFSSNSLEYSVEDSVEEKTPATPSRLIECESCKDDPNVSCIVCSCCFCGEKSDPDKQIICDECDSVFHVWCLIPGATTVQDVAGDEQEDWFCPDCLNVDAKIIQEKETLFLSKRIAGKARGAKRENIMMMMRNKEEKQETETNDENDKKKTGVSRENELDKMTRGHSLSQEFWPENLKLVKWNKISLEKEDQVEREEDKSKKKSRKRGHNETCSWGHGMACVGRRFLSNDAPSSTFFGPLPNIEVGTTWKFRFQVSELGLHTPLVSGVAGKESLGASSLVFSGCFEHDIDLGDEIYFSGTGGWESNETGSRTSLGRKQVKDQTLTRGNRALAMSCAAQFDEVKGGFTRREEWKLGKPIRVLRNGNGRKRTSQYLPKTGIRYDGIYKVVKYWPERMNDKIVWRFLLKRDDPVPAPWTREGKNRLRRLNLNKVIMPSMNDDKQSTQNGKVCGICLDSIQDTNVMKTKCSHSFCRVIIVCLILLSLLTLFIIEFSFDRTAWTRVSL